MNLWTHTTVEQREHSTITTYHLTDEAKAALTVHTPPRPRRFQRLRRWWFAFRFFAAYCGIRRRGGPR